MSYAKPAAEYKYSPLMYFAVATLERSEEPTLVANAYAVVQAWLLGQQQCLQNNQFPPHTR